MNKNEKRKLAKLGTLALALMMVFSLIPGALTMMASAAGDKSASVEVKSLVINLDSAKVYDSAAVSGPPDSITIGANSTMDFTLEWKTIGNQQTFYKDDTLTFLIATVTNLNFTSYTLPELVGVPSTTATGEFIYENNQLLFIITFHRTHTTTSGWANGSASWSFSQTNVPDTIHFGDEGDFTTIVIHDTDDGPDTPPVNPPNKLTEMKKAAFSPTPSSGKISFAGAKNYGTVQNPKYGLDWRLTFFDLDKTGTTLKDNIIITDDISVIHAFENYSENNSKAADKGFNNNTKPFFVEMPIIGQGSGSNRIFNLVGGSSILATSSSDTYVSTYINKTFTQITSGEIEKAVKETKYSWGLVTGTLSDGTTASNRLVINLGPYGEKITVRDSTYFENTIIEKIINPLEAANKKIAQLPAGSDAAIGWEEVKADYIATLKHYWSEFSNLGESEFTGLDLGKLRKLAVDIDYMPLESFILRYRTVTTDTTSSVKNEAAVSISTTTTRSDIRYEQVFGGGLDSVDNGEIGIIKVDSRRETRSGAVQKTVFDAAATAGVGIAVFNVYDNSANTPQKLKFIKDVDGKYTLDDSVNASADVSTNELGGLVIKDLPKGDYYLKEITTPFGYYVETAKQVSFTIDAAGEKYLIFPNTPRAVKLTKVDAENASTKLAGAVFTLHKIDTTVQGPSPAITGFKMLEDGVYFFTENENNNVKLTTNSNGVLEVRGLAAGEYYLQEVKAPDGYKLATPAPTKAFKLENDLPTGNDYDANHVLLLGNVENAVNKELPTITLYKKNRETVNGPAQDFSGVTFTLTRRNGPTKDFITGTGGKLTITFPEKDFDGTYVLKETTPVDYREIGEITFTISDKGEVKGVSWNEAYDHLIDWDAASKTFTVLNLKNHWNENGNDYYLAVFKIDKDTKKPLQNAEFTLEYPAAQNMQPAKATTDKDGIAVFKMNTDYAGAYKITEVKAPDGYNALTSTIEFTLEQGALKPVDLGTKPSFVLDVTDGLCIMNQKKDDSSSSSSGSSSSSRSSSSSSSRSSSSSSRSSSHSTSSRSSSSSRGGGGGGTTRLDTNGYYDTTTILDEEVPLVQIDDTMVPIASYNPGTGDSAAGVKVAVTLVLLSGALMGIGFQNRRRKIRKNKDDSLN